MRTGHWQELVDAAVASVSGPDGLQLEVVPLRDQAGKARLRVRYAGAFADYAVEARSHLATSAIPRLAQRPPKRREIVLVTEQVSDGQAESLRRNGIQFLDTAGNAFLQLANLYLFIKGNRTGLRFPRPETPRLFKPAGLKIVFLCLADPAIDGPGDTSVLNRPLEELARMAGVSLGSASNTRRALEDAGFAEKMSTGVRRIVRRPDLLEKWVAAYSERLRPKLVSARYRAPTPNWWQQAELDPTVGLWGGEVAAAKMTGHLRPEAVTIYRLSTLNRFLAAHALRLDPAGDVEILDAFWHDQRLRFDGCVPPVLAYAELLASDIDRNIEAAKELYAQHIRETIETA